MPVRSLRMVLFQHFLLQQWWLRRSASFFLTLHADLALEHLSSKISSPFDNWFSKMKAYRFWQSTFPTGPTENLARTADFVECLLVIARQLGYQWSASTCKTWCLIVLFGTKSQAKRWHKGKAFCLPYNFENDDVPLAIDVGSRYHIRSPLKEKPGEDVAARQARQVSSLIVILLVTFLNHWTSDQCCRLSWSWLWKRLRKSWTTFNLLQNELPQKPWLHQLKCIRLIPKPKGQGLPIQWPRQLPVRTLVVLLHLLLPFPSLRQGWTSCLPVFVLFALFFYGL